MANISDIIEAFLLDTLGQDDTVNISRNELADYFACAPSQINYVLSTRFTPDRGFIIESRRGGGGSITVIRLSEEPAELVHKLLTQTDDESFSFNKASHIIDRMTADKLICEREAAIIRAAVSDKALFMPSSGALKGRLRASVLRSIVMELLKDYDKSRDTDDSSAKKENKNNNTTNSQKEDK